MSIVYIRRCSAMAIYVRGGNIRVFTTTNVVRILRV